MIIFVFLKNETTTVFLTPNISLERRTSITRFLTVASTFFVRVFWSLRISLKRNAPLRLWHRSTVQMWVSIRTVTMVVEASMGTRIIEIFRFGFTFRGRWSLRRCHRNASLLTWQLVKFHLIVTSLRFLANQIYQSIKITTSNCCYK